MEVVSVNFTQDFWNAKTGTQRKGTHLFQVALALTSMDREQLHFRASEDGDRPEDGTLGERR